MLPPPDDHASVEKTTSELFEVNPQQPLHEQWQTLKTVNDAVEARYARQELGLGDFRDEQGNLLVVNHPMIVNVYLTNALRKNKELMELIQNIRIKGYKVQVVLYLSQTSTPKPE